MSTEQATEFTPCAEGCEGYGPFDVNREPHPDLVYTHEPDLEINRCDMCKRFADDEAAHAYWVSIGSPVLGGVSADASVRNAISALSREELEAALFGIARLLYTDEGAGEQWNRDAAWDGDTLPMVDKCIPKSVYEAVKVRP